MNSERLLFVVVATTVAVVAGVSIFFATLQRQADGPADGTPGEPQIARPVDPDTLVLFFVSADGLGLVQHERTIVGGGAQDTLTRARMVVEEQLTEAPAPLASPFPEGTRARAIYLTPTGDAFVDLSLEVSRGHAGGSLDELFTVYALVNALTTNVPEVSAVQILVDGREVDTLAGHVDLRRPLRRSMQWVNGASASSGPEANATDTTEG